MDSQPPVEYCFLWIDRWYMCMDKPSWASWVQAVGSIVAILAAVLIALWQHRREIRRARTDSIQAEIRRYEALLQLMGRGQDVAKKFVNFLDSELENSGDESWRRLNNIVAGSRAEMESCDDAFGRIDPLMFDRADVAEAVLACGAMIRLFIVFITGPGTGSKRKEAYANEWRDTALGLQKQFTPRLEAVRTAIAALKAELHET